MHRYGRFLSGCAAWLVGSTIPVSLVCAETSRIGTLPSKPGLARFVMVADMEVTAGNGYQPISLRFSPLGKSFKRDRHLQVVLEPRNDRQTDLDLTYRRNVTVPEGATTHRVTIYVPHYYPWDEVDIALFEGGRLVETGKSTFRLGLNVRTRCAGQNSTVGIIAPADASLQDAPWKVYPDVRTLVTILGDGPIPEDVDVKRLSHQAAIKLANRVQPAWVQFRPISESRLFDRWLGYSQLDVIIVAAPVLERIEQQRPEEFGHLKNWVAAGGNLWVFAGSRLTDDSFLGKLSMGAVESHRVIAPRSVASHLNLQSDNDTSRLVFMEGIGTYKESSQYAYRTKRIDLPKREDVYHKLRSKQHPFANTVAKDEIAGILRVGSLGLGTVVVIAPDDPFPGSFQFWKSVVKLHDDGQVVWVDRNGIDVPRGNDNYWMWLIPSVGRPPVKSFVFLNTLFVVLIGPVCYFFFRKRQRLYLLYFVAPCMALVVTVCLFAYALRADGTRTKIRSRRLTWVDSNGGYTVAQARQTYYAVLGSGGGIELSDDAAIYPVRNAPAFDHTYRDFSRSSRRGEISFGASRQLLSGTFLPPRDQVQYLVTHPTPVEKTIEFELSSDGNKVISHLPFMLRRLVVCDANRKFWQGQDVATGASIALRSVDSSTLADLLGPDVLPPLDSVPMLQSAPRRRGGRGTGTHVSLLEKRLEMWANRLPPKSFVAIAELVDDTFGVDNAVVLDSVHVVMGEIP